MNMKEERESGTERQERQVKEEGWETGGETGPVGGPKKKRRVCAQVKRELDAGMN